jgi:hypothetical protein
MVKHTFAAFILKYALYFMEIATKSKRERYPVKDHDYAIAFI